MYDWIDPPKAFGPKFADVNLDGWWRCIGRVAAGGRWKGGAISTCFLWCSVFFFVWSFSLGAEEWGVPAIIGSVILSTTADVV